MLEAAICTIGDEILIGQITDTNSAAISRALGSIGVRVRTMVSVGDDRNEIASCLSTLLNSHDIVFTTGGLGPTKDDITKKVLAELSGAVSWHEDAAQMEIVKRILVKRGIPLSDNNLQQAWVPDTCSVIPNRLGTAPVMVFSMKEGLFKGTPLLYSLPGVPYEAIGALQDINDDIRRRYSLSDIYHKTIVTFGIAESTLANMISDWEDSLPEDMKLAYLPDPAVGVKLRLSIYGGRKEEEEQRIDEAFSRLRPILSDAIYGCGEDTLEIVVGRMLKEHGTTVSTAESCTGGTVSSMITSVPGASEYFLGSVVSYSNSVKHSVLGVSEEILDTYGAVSEECVRAMASGARQVTGSDFAVATSGIAGPSGETEDKPVGLVWIAVATPKSTKAARFVFSSDRKRNITRFASNALNMLRLEIARYYSSEDK